MAGNWRYWDQGCRSLEEGTYTLVGTTLKLQGSRPPGRPRYRRSPGHGRRLRKKDVQITPSAQGVGTRPAGDQSARAAPQPRTRATASTTALPRTKVPRKTEAKSTKVVQLKGPVASGVPLKTTVGWTEWSVAEPGPQKPRTFSALSRTFHEWPASATTSLASVALSDLWDEGLGSRGKSDDFGITPTSYLGLIIDSLKLEKPTRAALRIMEKTMEVLKLDRQIKEARIQQKVVLEETRLLLDEKCQVQADTKFMLDHLTNKTEEYRREINKLWDDYAQESGEIQRKRHELASKYAKQTSELQKQLLEKEKKEFDLKQQLRAMRDISLVKEKQDRELQTLHEELKKARAETMAKAYAHYLQEKASLEMQLSEPETSLLGRRERRELKKKAQALEVAAEKVAFEFCRDLLIENQWAHKKLMQQSQQYQEVLATLRCLQDLKKQLQQEQWYTECLIRGRQRLQQGAPKTTKIPSLGSKSKTNPQ
ncbi:Coiled-coil domain-containing protein 121 [Myotis davidii]|uniref:Coiled-coil domain-containing protein 121 n=1 Tax=Myotis davidii TaxID=225400 RepID=L5MEL4_MYODS|nr:Coiled-coil domain-containing protein 121 [Myotis davidii]